MRLLALAPPLVLRRASSFEPIGLEQVGFLERSQTQQESGVRVTVAVPSESETRELFHIPLYDRGVQPVWIEIENGRENRVTFLPVGVDAEYFTPVETATLDLAVGQAPEQDQGRAAQYCRDRSSDMRVGPG